MCIRDRQYTATIEKAKDEQNTKNNTVSFVVNVLESKQKILILSDGPHPDIGSIKYLSLIHILIV